MSMHEPKTFAEKLYEEKVLRGLKEEDIQAILNTKEEDFGPAQTAEEFLAELQVVIDAATD